MGIVYRLGIGITNRKPSISGLPGYLRDKFLFLWLGDYQGDNLLNSLGTDYITVTNKDWSTKVIPDTTSATFSVPNNASYLNADGAEDFWFNSGNTLLQKTFTQLIESTTFRTFVKYNEDSPYFIYAIGVLKQGETISDEEKVILTKYFRLWVQYWSTVMMEQGYMKDNRTFIED